VREGERGLRAVMVWKKLKINFENKSSTNHHKVKVTKKRVRCIFCNYQTEGAVRPAEGQKNFS
jgi:ATP-dependent protease Clp ATPase subunit